jgi:hypothetical protein
MRALASIALLFLPSAAVVAGCSGSSTGIGCPVDPQCYVVESSGECSVDTAATCSNGTWLCSTKGKLGSGCLPDGGIAPPPDAGACPLATLEPPLACTSDATCAPYGGHCVYDLPPEPGPGPDPGEGECVCGPEPQYPVEDAGPDADACSLDCYGDVCKLPSFTIDCSGPNDPTCAQYNAECDPSYVGPDGGVVYTCECTGGPVGTTGGQP